MRWEGERESENVEDRRGVPGGRGVAIGGGGLLVLVLFALVTGQDPRVLLDVISAPQQSSIDAGQQGQARAPAAPPGRVSATVLASTEDVGQVVLRKYGHDYRDPTLVLFNDSVDSACGLTSSAVGPFYCPGDQKLYLDLSFFDDLDRRFGAPGDF